MCFVYTVNKSEYLEKYKSIFPCNSTSNESAHVPPRKLLCRGFSTPVHLLLFDLYHYLRTKAHFDFHPFEWAGVDIHWFAVDGFYTGWIPTSFSFGRHTRTQTHTNPYIYIYIYIHYLPMNFAVKLKITRIQIYKFIHSHSHTHTLIFIYNNFLYIHRSIICCKLKSPIRTCTHTHTYTHTQTQIHTHTHTYTRTHPPKQTKKNTHIHTHINIYIHVYKYTCIYIYTNIF